MLHQIGLGSLILVCPCGWNMQLAAWTPFDSSPRLAVSAITNRLHQSTPSDRLQSVVKYSLYFSSFQPLHVACMHWSDEAMAVDRVSTGCAARASMADLTPLQFAYGPRQCVGAVAWSIRRPMLPKTETAPFRAGNVATVVGVSTCNQTLWARVRTW